MRQLAKDLGIADYVTFTGRVPDAELLEMLNTADICVNPDRANDMNDRSTMNKVMEYMALGKPVVQFDLTEGRVVGRRGVLVRAAQRRRRPRTEDRRAARRRAAARPHERHRARTHRTRAVVATRGTATAGCL